MKRTISLFSVFVVLAMAVPAEAQYRSRGGYGGGYGEYRRPLPGGWGGGYGGYGYYDPSYLQQMMSLPESLAACSVDFSTGHVVSCRPVVKEIGAIQAYLQNPEGMFGTVHVEKGKMHFRPFDDTNNRLGRGGATAIGTTGGAVAGAVFGGKKGAVIGGGVGALTGWLASHKFNRHDNCLVIEPVVARSVPVEVQSPAPSQEQGRTSQPIAGPAANVGQGQFELSNETRVYVEAYDGDEYIGRMAPGSTMTVDPPKDRYRGFALVPTADGRLGKDELSREVSPSGWLFIEPKAAPGR